MSRSCVLCNSYNSRLETCTNREGPLCNYGISRPYNTTWYCCMFDPMMLNWWRAALILVRLPFAMASAVARTSAEYAWGKAASVFSRKRG